MEGVSESSGRWRERGAAMVEMAMVMTLLVVMIMGIVEFGFLLGEVNELKHGAHEGARLAAVNEANLVSETCDSMDLSAGSNVSLSFTRTGSEIGDGGSVLLTANISSLTGLGLIEVFLPSQLTSEADFRLEQMASWSNPTNGSC